MNPELSETLATLRAQKQATDSATQEMCNILAAVEQELIDLNLGLCVAVPTGTHNKTHLVFDMQPGDEAAGKWRLGLRNFELMNGLIYLNTKDRHQLMVATAALPALIAKLEELNRSRMEETVAVARTGKAMLGTLKAKKGP